MQVELDTFLVTLYTVVDDLYQQHVAEAAIGVGGSDKDWYYGCKALLSCTDQGLITGFVVGPASTEERWLAEALLCWRDDPRATPWGAADPPPAHRNRGRFRGPTGPIWPRLGPGPDRPLRYVADRGFFGLAWQTHWLTDYLALVETPRDFP